MYGYIVIIAMIAIHVLREVFNTKMPKNDRKAAVIAITTTATAAIAAIVIGGINNG